MISRRRQDGHGLEGGAFVVLSDIFINTVFLMVVMLIAVTLTSASSSALKQEQIQDDQKRFEALVASAFPRQWNRTILPYDNGNYQRLTFSDNLFFDAGHWDLKPDAQPLLNALAPLLRAQIRNNKIVKIVIEGHTDQQAMGASLVSKVGDSWGLSSLRSMAVVRYLQSQNVPPEALTAVGRGQFSPLSDTPKDDLSYSRNRRIEVILVYAAGGDDHGGSS